VSGDVPPEIWNRLGTKLLPKLRSGAELSVGVNFAVTVETGAADSLVSDLRQILDDLSLTDKVSVDDE